MATAWTDAGKAAGYQVAVNGEYAPGAKDFSDLILKAKSANADLVLGLPTPPDGMTMVKQMKELGLSPKMLLLIRAPDPPVWSKNLGRGRDHRGAGPPARRGGGRGPFPCGPRCAPLCRPPQPGSRPPPPPAA